MLNKIAIIGAGAVGCATTAMLSQKGFEIRLYNRTLKKIQSIQERGGVDVIDKELNYFVRIEKITDNIVEAVKGADLILVMTTCNDHREIAKSLASIICNGQVPLLCSGGAGILEFVRICKELVVASQLLLGETATMPYYARMLTPTQVKVVRLANTTRASAFPGKRTSELCEVIVPLFDTIPVKNVLDTGINNPNWHRYPISMVLNYAEAERKKGLFSLMNEGMTESVLRALDAFDKERMSLQRMLGLPMLSVDDLYTEFGSGPWVYRVKGEPMGIKDKIHPRYLDEDIPYGSMFLTSLGNLIGVRTPIIDATNLLSAVITGKDYWREARTCDRLGLSGLEVEQILYYLKGRENYLMKIVSISITSTKIPTIRPHQMKIGTTFYQENTIIRMITDTDIIGYGEAPHMLGHSALGETPNTVRTVLQEKIVPAILEQDPRQVENIWDIMRKTVPGNIRAKSSIIIACYDIIGKYFKTPIYNLLGGKVRDKIPLSWSLPIDDFDFIIEEAHKMINRGWKILKLKVGRENPLDDIEAFKRVRQAVGPEIILRADANQAYNPNDAMRVIAGMAEWDLEFMEQPCPAWDLNGLAWVRKNSPIPIMLDESLKTVYPIKNLAEIIRREVADYLSIYVCDSGGILNAKKMAALAEAFNMKGYIGGALESIIGVAAALHIASSSPAISLGCEAYGQYFLLDDIGVNKITMKEGCLVVPDGFGIGIEIDENKIKQYEVGKTIYMNKK